jgi:branched-chain amino acid transport system ATP-binding protein
MSFFEIENLSLSFGGVKAVDDASFSMDKGEVFTIVGPNRPFST